MFFEHVLPAAVRSVSREAPLQQDQEQEQEQEQDQEQEQEQEQDALLWNYFSTNLFVFLK